MEIEVDGVTTAFEVHGEGRPVVLLHGFPDSGRVWRNQVPALVDGGFQVIVPDLRGYGASGKPEGVEAYNMLSIAGDVLAVLDHVGVERAHVVGHDWGAALSWAIAAFVPDRVDHLVALSVGNPSAFRAAGLEQQEKSWYMLFFQAEGVAEQWLSDDGWANLRAWSNHPDLDAAVAELDSNGSLTPALNWYRANIGPESWVGPPIAFPPIAAPTMGVWSTGDFALTEAQMAGSAEFVSGPWRYERLEGLGHWMQLEDPAAVNALLLDFLPADG